MNKQGNRLVDETGNRHGRLIVLKRVENEKRGEAMWLCRCECGNETRVIGYDLRRGHSRSCGCLKIDTDQRRTLPSGDAGFNIFYNGINKSAKRRGYVFELTREQARKLSQGNCHYCNAPPKQVIRGGGRNGAFAYNGIDRVENSQGYTIENVVSCCKWCNTAKGIRSENEFKQWIAKVDDHWARRVT